MRPADPVTVTIESLSHDGRGIVSLQDKVTFVQDALPGETVRIVVTRKHRRYNEADTLAVLTPSPDRITPPCPHASLCGGCSLQHLAPTAQIVFYESMVKDQLRRTGHVAPDTWLPPITGPSTGYRRKARLGVRYVHKKGKLLVGFREKRSNYLADLSACLVLDPRIGLKLTELATLLATLDARESIPQIEVAAGDETVGLVLRHLEPLSEQDLERLRQFGHTHGFHLWLQPNAPDLMTKLWPEDSLPWLSYALPRHALTLRFHPTDFTQVNPVANQHMIDRALELLAIQPTDRILDLFCGLGNFTLPIAKQAASVTGVEGSLEMVRRARDNATLNDLNNTAFFVANLAEPDPQTAWLQKSYDSILLDPPRTGAREMLPLLAKTGAKKIVYVSCNPATLARDAAILVNEYGYRLTAAGIVDMFPQTSHVETIALFELSTRKRNHGDSQTKISS